mgnify:CR=1 FL=1
MSDNEGPTWYTPGDVPGSIEAATIDSSVYVEHIVDVLQAHELDAPRSRIRTLVTSARDRISERNSTPTDSSDPLEEPRAVRSRIFDVEDATYLGERNLATILGVALSRYAGSFSLVDPQADSVLDLLWNKQHTTVGFHVVTRPEQEPLTADHVTALHEGNIATGSGRSPAQLAVISPATATERARSVAEDHEIMVVDADVLRRWFNEVRLTPALVGQILEAETVAYNELEHLISELDPLPEIVASRDPLDVSHSSPPIATGDTSAITTSIDQALPVEDETPPPGTQGKLYANPSDDGDFGAFDRFVDNLEEDTS